MIFKDQKTLVVKEKCQYFKKILGNDTLAKTSRAAEGGGWVDQPPPLVDASAKNASFLTCSLT